MKLFASSLLMSVGRVWVHWRFFLFCFFLSFAVLVVPFASFRLFGLSFHIFHVQTVPFGVNAHLEDCKYCWNCCAICAATGPTWQTPGSHGYTGYRTGKDARCCKMLQGLERRTQCHRLKRIETEVDLETLVKLSLSLLLSPYFFPVDILNYLFWPGWQMLTDWSWKWSFWQMKVCQATCLRPLDGQIAPMSYNRGGVNLGGLVR